MKRKDKRPRKILLGVTGSIAAYKAAELVRLMKAEGWDVTVILTRAAREFVTELTFRTLSRNPVHGEMFTDTAEWVPDHLSLADGADVLCIAPCTANVMAKMAHGIADDLLTCTALSVKAPVVIAPAMNAGMWTHAATRANAKTLAARGVRIVEPGEGDLACGVRGKGRLAPLEAILSAVKACWR